MIKELKKIFSPNHDVSKGTMLAIAMFQLIFLVVVWMAAPSVILPKPGEVWHAFVDLWLNQGLGQEFYTSFVTNLEAVVISTGISLMFAYLTVMPFMRPVVGAISKLRFLGLTGLTFFFALMIAGGHELKVSLLVFGMTVFFVTNMAAEIAAIPKEQFDHARTLRMGEWRVVWEVIVLGRADRAIEVLRQNAAIGWMMLTMVEGIVRSEGGVGAMLLNQNKHLHLDAIFAIQIAILAVGMIQDYGIGVIKSVLCPYADLKLERK